MTKSLNPDKLARKLKKQGIKEFSLPSYPFSYLQAFMKCNGFDVDHKEDEVMYMGIKFKLDMDIN